MTLTSLASFNIHAPSDCAEAYRDAVRNVTQSTETQDFSTELKTYFSSDTFRQDLQSGKWGGTLGLVIDGAPVSLGANANNQAVSNFVQQVQGATTLDIGLSTKEYVYTSMADPAALQKLNECFAIQNQGGGGFAVEQKTVSNATVSVTFSYRAKFQQIAPIVKFGTEVRNAAVGTVTGLPTQGQALPNQFVVTFDRVPGKVAIIVIQTDYESYAYPILAESRTHRLHVEGGGSYWAIMFADDVTIIPDNDARSLFGFQSLPPGIAFSEFVVRSRPTARINVAILSCDGGTPVTPCDIQVTTSGQTVRGTLTQYVGSAATQGLSIVADGQTVLAVPGGTTIGSDVGDPFTPVAAGALTFEF